MAQTTMPHGKYLEDQRAFEDNLSGSDPVWIDELRQKGRQAFKESGFPTGTRGNERWKYTNVSPISTHKFEFPFGTEDLAATEQDIKIAAPWDDKWARLVFIDGHFSNSRSNCVSYHTGFHVKSLADAIKEDGDLVREHLGRYAEVDQDGFTAVNTAFLHEGAFVNVEDAVESGTVLHLIFVSTGLSKPTVSYPRTLILMGSQSRLTLIESYIGISEESYFSDPVTEIFMNEGANLEHYRYLNESPNAYHIGTTRVCMERDSQYKSTSFSKGAALARNDIKVLLNSPGASCNLNGLYLTSGQQHIDNYIDIDHSKPHTRSDQNFKGILTDNSRAVFSGRVLVRPDAQKAFARQSDKNLLLSEGARVNTKPSLEISADDVQCFHGATAGSIPEEALFYMRSRGIDRDAALRLLIQGFASEIIDVVKLESLRDYLNNSFLNSLRSVRFHQEQNCPETLSLSK